MRSEFRSTASSPDASGTPPGDAGGKSSTDSTYIQCVGADLKLGPMSNGGARHPMNAYRSVGFVLTIYHSNVNDTQANCVADTLANKSRLIAQSFDDARPPTS